MSSTVNQQKVLRHKGCALAYQVAGSGIPVLLIQGVGVHGSGWRPQVEGLKAQHHCLSFDNRGIGASQPGSGKLLSVDQMVEDALRLMDAEGWSSAHVAGHSLGGLVALHLALSQPARVRSLSLLCTFARGSDATSLSAWMLWVGLRTRIGTRRQRREAFLQLVLPPDELARVDREKTAADLAQIFGHDLADHPPVVMDQMRAMRAYDATPRLAELAKIQTIVLSARHDRIAKPEFGKAIAKGIPGARYVEFDDASHGAPIQFAERTNTLLIEHIASAENRGV